MLTVQLCVHFSFCIQIINTNVVNGEGDTSWFETTRKDLCCKKRIKNTDAIPDTIPESQQYYSKYELLMFSWVWVKVPLDEEINNL